ncbi:MAG: Bacteriophage protein [Candidatus Pacebacteria bacterium GW2011_GWF2_38_9]|nr:MAG: Bacteriophage protein [Candidatus Pacebacteria bacterium GW2011_GWF2_38_9]
MEQFQSVKIVFDKTKEIFEALDYLENIDVLVGIPENKTERKADEMTNAELAYIHTVGSPANNLPARPFLEPAIEDKSEEISEKFKEAIPAALDGKKDEVKKILNQVGALVAGAASDWFTNPKNNWEPLADSTIKSRLYSVGKTTRKKYKNMLEAGKNPFNPLIDTGQLRRAITWVLRNK